MPLIDKSYFVGELNIPNTSDTSVLQRLNFFIAKYEKEYLRTVLGAAFYASFNAGTSVVAPDTIEQLWLDLQNGIEYTYNGKAYSWPGLKDDTLKQSPIANYVYYWWLRDNATLSSGIGEVKAKSNAADNRSASEKMVRAWNEMVDWNYSLIDYLYAYRTVYTTWNQDYGNISRIHLFKYINNFNL